MANGTVTKLAKDRNFGFIADDNGSSYFFHRGAVRDPDFMELEIGDKVTFKEETSEKGPRAWNVVVDNV